MSIIIDREFISLLASRLEGFKQKRNGVFNCRCPLCGDSDKSSRKKRFYFYEKKGEYFTRCHNCAHSSKFVTFLKIFDTELYKEYSLTLFKEQTKLEPKVVKDHAKVLAEQKQLERMTTGVDYSRLIHFGNLPLNHPARQYVDGRCVPHDRILYSPSFRDWLRTIEIDQYLKDRFDHLNIPVMVIPFYTKRKHSRVFQIRTFDPNFKPKYITFKMDEDDLKIFGLERINPHKLVYIVEGPIDAMGVENTLAFSGASAELPDHIKKLRRAYFLDNEPRNREIVNSIQKLIDGGESVVILSDRYKYNDVNDMIKAGVDAERIFRMHTYKGVTAQLKFNNWKRI